MLRFQARDRTGFLTDTRLISLALDYARRAKARNVEDFVLGWLCITLHRGSVPVVEAIARATEIRESSSSTYVKTSALGALGLLYAMRGDFEEGRAAVAEVSATFQELGLGQSVAAHSIAVAEVELLAGDDAAAERILRDGLAAVTAIRDEHSTKNVAWRLALVLTRQGRPDEAEPFVRIAQDPNQQGYWVDVWWRVVLARIEAQRDGVAEVTRLVEEARERMALVDESGMHADALLESAEALRAVGLEDEASALVAEAARIAGGLGYVVAARRAAQLAVTA
jgi:tetratricopeptide (TPR) repeat protein